MPVDITIPSPGESIPEVTLGPWHKSAGDWVEKDETLVEIESDKVTLEVPAPEAGVLSIDAQEGEEKNVGDKIGAIDTAAAKPAAAQKPETQSKDDQPPAQAPDGQRVTQQLRDGVNGWQLQQAFAQRSHGLCLMR